MPDTGRDDMPPDPRRSASAAEFVTEMRRLRAWSGLTFRQLERNAAEAGDVLPHSTLVDALRRDRLPREDLLRAFVRACGLGAGPGRRRLGPRSRWHCTLLITSTSSGKKDAPPAGASAPG